MSWDVLILNAPSDVDSPDNLGPDFKSTLGSRRRVTDLLQSLFPDLDLSDPSWGVLDHSQYSVEFSLGHEDPIETIMLHVRGSNEAVTAIQRLCEAGNWRAMDMGNCEFIDFGHKPAAGLEAWRRFRDEAVDRARTEGAEVDVEPETEAVRLDAVVGVANSGAQQDHQSGSNKQLDDTDGVYLDMAKSGLTVENGELIKRNNENIVARHALSSIKAARLGHRFDPMAAILAIVGAGLTVVFWRFIQSPLWSWILVVIFGGLTLVGTVACFPHKLVISIDDREIAYTLLEPTEEMKGFVLSLKQLLEKRHEDH